MTLKLCLRCDWDGETELRRCPNCGAYPLYAAASRHPDSLTDPDDVAPGGNARTPASGASDVRTWPHEARSMSVALAAGLLVVLVALGTWLSSDRAATNASATGPSTGEAAAVAARFLRAYGELDVDRAIDVLADDADLSLLIRSIGADGVEGTVQEFRWYVELLEAWRYRQSLGTCDPLEGSAPDTVIRCGFDYDFLGSDDLGFGPYTGSSVDVTVRDGEVVAVSKFWAFDRFSREMWEPFSEWIAAGHPGAASQMYEDPSRRGVQLDRGSIRRWAHYTDAYVRLKITARVVPHDDG
ncbi:MAG TPA: hypothetical protein VK549_11475 [Acidimicrobiia bacterium]|nr:hypothetical protein [Acidimicrobiia bacterium]